MQEELKKYEEAKQAIYKHAGLVEDWVVFPLDDQTDMYWQVDDDEVIYAETEEQVRDLDDRGGDYYKDDVYVHRFYEKSVYEGAELTLIMCNPHVDGMIWWRLFDNSKKII